MSNPAKNEMDVDAFLVWAEGRDGRWELRDGQPVMMSPERAAHALTKFSAQIALRESVQRAALPCRVFPDGMTVRITARNAFEPDALVVCPPPTDLNTMEIPNPVIVVEVLSPSTAADDHGLKLDGYFSLAQRRALPDPRPRPAGDDPSQARSSRGDRDPHPARWRRAVRPARLRSRGRRVLRGGLNSAPAARFVGAPRSGAPTSQL